MSPLVSLHEFGSSFATRAKAEELTDGFRRVLDTMTEGVLTVSLTDVRAISPSFTSGFFDSLGKLLSRPEYRKWTVKVMAENDLIKERLQYVREKHLVQSASHEALGRIIIE